MGADAADAMTVRWLRAGRRPAKPSAAKLVVKMVQNRQPNGRRAFVERWMRTTGGGRGLRMPPGDYGDDVGM